ncbi:hypothetical protein K469DRAFT_713948, partial [Zopfia rhizophila CBS 207.26]
CSSPLLAVGARSDVIVYLEGPSRETRIRKPPDVRLPGSQPGPKLASSSQPMWTRPRRTTGHPWACTSSETERGYGEGVGNLFL